MLITARILLTLAALGFSAITIVADLNKTHASNPLWTPHARFHVVWQVLSYSGIGLIALYLIWAGGPMQTERFYLAAALAVYGAFFGAVLSRPVYGAACSTPTAIRRFRRRSARKPGCGMSMSRSSH
jgi:hypothetical protein